MEQGTLLRGKYGFRDAVRAGVVQSAHIETEVRTQVQWFISKVFLLLLLILPQLFFFLIGEAQLQLGRKPTHVDGHQHIHVIPLLVPLLAQIFSELGITR